MKSIKQIADELGVSKQKVYRYIKNHGIEEVNQDCINETHQRIGTKYYDEVAENLIKQGFGGENASNEAHQECINDTVIDTLLMQIETLQKELNVKNEQIGEKDKQIFDTLKALDQAQQLQAMAENRIKLLESKQEEEKSVEPEKKHWWKIWR